jgi:MFS family permease
MVIEKNSIKAWVICLTCALFFFYDFVQFMMGNSLSMYLISQFGISASGLSNFGFAFLITDIIFLFPAGIILDRFSPRLVTLITLFISVIGTYGLVVASSFETVLIFRAISGVAHAFCFLCCISFVSKWFSPENRAKVIGIIITIAMLGGVFAQTPLLMLMDKFAWTNTMLILTFIGIFIWVISFFVLEDSPKEDENKTNTNINDMNFMDGLKQVFKNSQNWLYGTYTGLLNLPVMVIAAAYGTMFLTTSFNLNESMATSIVSMINFGVMIGAPVMGYISDSLNKRKSPIIIGGFITLLLSIIILYVDNLSATSLFVLFLSLGFFSSAQVISYPAITESNPINLSSTATGLCAALIMGIGAIGIKLAGYILDLNWDGKMVNQAVSYSSENFKIALIIIPVGILVAFVLSLMVKETNCKQI